MTFCDRRDRFIVKIFRRMTSAAERIPRLHHNAVFTDIFLQSGVLIKNVVFVLNNGGRYLRGGVFRADRRAAVPIQRKEIMLCKLKGDCFRAVSFEDI